MLPRLLRFHLVSQISHVFVSSDTDICSVGFSRRLCNDLLVGTVGKPFASDLEYGPVEMTCLDGSAQLDRLCCVPLREKPQETPKLCDSLGSLQMMHLHLAYEAPDRASRNGNLLH